MQSLADWVHWMKRPFFQKKEIMGLLQSGGFMKSTSDVVSVFGLLIYSVKTHMLPFISFRSDFDNSINLVFSLQEICFSCISLKWFHNYPTN